jgi:hypothetical protein
MALAWVAKLLAAIDNKQSSLRLPSDAPWSQDM